MHLKVSYLPSYSLAVVDMYRPRKAFRGLVRSGRRCSPTRSQEEWLEGSVRREMEVDARQGQLQGPVRG
jgi:hypothetical protein